MLNSLTADSIYSQIMMEEAPPKAYFLVEGPDESAIFYGHIDSGVELIVTGGKKNLLGAAKLAEANDYHNVYGLVDNDFDDLLQPKKLYPPHVVATGAYDLVSDLVLSTPGILQRILSAHALEAVKTIEEVTNSSIDNAVYNLTTAVAGARLATLRENYPFIFNDYAFHLIIDESYGPADTCSILEKAKKKDPNFDVDAAVIDKVHRALSSIASERRYTGGHDLVRASVALLKAANSQVTTKGISANFISIATCDALGTLKCLKKLEKLMQRESRTNLLECCTTGGFSAYAEYGN